jgi:hypothetical protein
MQKEPKPFTSRSWRPATTGDFLFTTVPVTFVALGLITGLSVDTYRAWGLIEVVVDCKPVFAVDLYDTTPQFHSGTPAHAKEQAIIAWTQGVIKTHGAPYANFWHAKESYTDVKLCHPDSDGAPNYCGFASGEPCRR